MPYHILSGAFNSTMELDEATARQIAHGCKSHLRSVGYTEYEIRTGYDIIRDVWQFLIILPEPEEKIPSLQMFDEVEHLFKMFVQKPYIKLKRSSEDCERDMPLWGSWCEPGGKLDEETRLCCDAVLGVIY
ncbi:hypothetical protein BJY04DRAFT_197140 [Aspergillus karnatakaensis]|uniref:uncharacterized protein n=1 Tax=Aspergillus karnatakaensis TaxID=1810916 RepID=UPI003CCD90F6